MKTSTKSDKWFFCVFLPVFLAQAECWKDPGQHIPWQHYREVRSRGARSVATMKFRPLQLELPSLSPQISSKISPWFLFHQPKWVESKCPPRCSETAHGCPSWTCPASSLHRRYQLPSSAQGHTKLILPLISLIITSKYCHSLCVTAYRRYRPWEFNELSIKAWISLIFMLG